MFKNILKVVLAIVLFLIGGYALLNVICSLFIVNVLSEMVGLAATIWGIAVNLIVGVLIVSFGIKAIRS